MEIYNKLTSIFSDKWFNIRYRGGVYDIVETDKCASVKMAEIEYHGKLMSIDKDIFNKTDFLFYDDDKTQNGMPKLKHSYAHRTSGLWLCCNVRTRKILISIRNAE